MRTRTRSHVRSFHPERFNGVTVSRRPSLMVRPQRSLIRPLVLQTQDRRVWHPAGVMAPLGALSRGARRIIIPPFFSSPAHKDRLRVSTRKRARPMPSSASSLLSDRVGFAVPKRVALCVRRHVRREVLHAKGKAGGAVRPPRRTFWSQVEC